MVMELLNTLKPVVFSFNDEPIEEEPKEVPEEDLEKDQR